MKKKVATPENLSTYERKCTSIGHAIMSAAHPKSFKSPLHISVKFINFINLLISLFLYNSTLLALPAAMLSATNLKFYSPGPGFELDELKNKMVGLK